jgi:hypothetical protein
MAEGPCAVILDGTLIEGFQRQEVVKNLSVLFRMDMEGAAGLLSGKPKVIKKRLDVETARKYSEMLTRAGAACRVELDPKYSQDTVAVTKTPDRVSDEGPSEVTSCPRCKYKPLSEDDVMLVRGDCPRCGLIVRKDAQVSGLSEGEDEDEEFDSHSENIYSDRTPASWQRRALATMHSLTLFLAAYLLLVILLIFLVFPPDLIPRTIAKEFLHTVTAAYPMTVSTLAILLVSFLLPILSRGRSWGQLLTEIEVLHTGEDRAGGFYLVIGSRVAAILLLSFVPGMVAARIGEWLGWLHATWAMPAVMLGTAVLAWGISGIVPLLRPDRRSVLDLAASTIQVEERALPAQAFPLAILPFIGIVGIWIWLCIGFPFVTSFFR